MLFHRIVLVAVTSASIGACSTTQQVSMAKSVIARPVSTVSQAAADGNSSEMDSNLESALAKEGFTVKAKLPAGTQTSKEVDAVVSYVDVWRWDIVMYMARLTVKVHDAQSGDLLAIGEWKDSALHGFRNAKEVMENLVRETALKIRAATKAEK